MRTFNVLLVVAGAAFVATCSSSLSTPGDGGPRGAGGRLGTGGSSGATALGGTGGSAGAGGAIGAGGGFGLGGTGGTHVLCQYGLGGTNGLGGATGLGGTNGVDGAVDAACGPNPLAGCPSLTASSPCGPGAVCANSSQDGRVDIDTCLRVPSGCDSCSCVENALVEFAKQFPNVFVPVYGCSCYEGQQRVDGGTPPNPITGVVCTGA